MKLEINGKSVTPLEYAEGVTATELRKVIRVIKKASYDEFSDRCRICFEKYLNKDIEAAKWWSSHAELVR